MASSTLRRWIRGVLGAAINSAANAITIVVVDPVDFNPFHPEAGWTRLLTVMAVSALFGAGLFLKQHPLPDEEEAPARV